MLVNKKKFPMLKFAGTSSERSTVYFEEYTYRQFPGFVLRISDYKECGKKLFQLNWTYKSRYGITSKIFRERLDDMIPLFLQNFREMLPQIRINENKEQAPHGHALG